MKKVVLFSLFILVSLLSHAQSNARINNYWENTYYINPAAIDDDYRAVFSMAARKQWFGVPGAPGTVFGTGTVYIDNMQTQFGVKLLADEIGYTHTMNASLSYAYSVHLDDWWRLHLGIAASIQSLSYDLSAVNTETLNDPAFLTKLLKTNNYNSDLGAQLTNNELTVGLSSQNIFSKFFKENALQTNTNFLYAKYRKKSNQTVDMQYGVAAINYGTTLQMEFSLTSYFKYYNEPDIFQVGLFYRTRSDMGVLLGVNLGNNTHLWYSYDYNVGGIQKNLIGTHELMLVYKLNKKAGCIHCDK
jgi:type IX secretion system PorP/SprF family membrane protein